MGKRAAMGVVILAALALSSLCFLYGVLHKVPGAVYTGIRSINASDINQHVSWIGQCREGSWLLRNQFTSEPHRGISIRLSYLILSQPFRLTDVSNPLAYHLQRLLCGAVLLFFLFRLFQVFGLNERQAWIAFLLLTFTSGLGFALRRWLPESSDLSIPESNLFLSLGDGPHFLFSLLFLWWGATSFFSATQGRRIGLLWCLVSVTVLWWDHPFDAVILIVVCAVNLWQIPTLRDRILWLSAAGVISLPAYLYYEWLKTQAGFTGWGSEQNLMLSPSFFSMLSGQFPLLALGIPAAAQSWKQNRNRRLIAFLAAWAVAQFLLAYAPFPFQRRLIAGVQLPLAILAAFTLDRLRKPLLIAAIIALCSIGSFMTMRQMIREIASGGMPFYLPEPYVRAFRWLQDQEKKGVILSGFVTGNFIPAYTGYTAYLGHSSLTPRIAEKRRNVEMFYRNPREEFLRENGFQYIFYGFEEQNLGRSKLETRLRPVYASGGVWILAAPPQ